MMKCLVCFESTTGVKPDDFFVNTKNGHVFHQCCLKEMMSTNPLCPVCDEDLRTQTLTELPPELPKRAPVATRMIQQQSRRQEPPSGAASSASGSGHRRELPSTPSLSFRVEPDYNFKIVILGDLNVGKSCLLQRFADDVFNPIITSTVGCDLRVKVLQIGGKIVRLNLWDTAGQERHKAVVDVTVRRADGIIFCFDVTDLASFLNLPTWYHFAEKFLPEDTVKIIAGTKSDLWSQRVVFADRINNLASLWNAQYAYTSAKDAVNVEMVFRSLAALILEKRLPSEMDLPPLPNIPNEKYNKERGDVIRLSSSKFFPDGAGKKSHKKVDKCCGSVYKV